jgi:hypothetical protein
LPLSLRATAAWIAPFPLLTKSSGLVPTFRPVIRQAYLSLPVARPVMWAAYLGTRPVLPLDSMVWP